jgi:hypothetical protein
MMYSNKLAAAIKAAGKVLREFDKDKVYLPFGSEYSIYLKNMHSTRAVAHVSIDGKDVGGGRGFVVPAHGSIDIERFVTNGNLNEGNRFKFIERTGKVEQHRGIGVEDGLIEITFQYEYEPVRVRHFVDPNWYGGPYNGGCIEPLIGSLLRGMSSGDQYRSGGTTTCSTTSASFVKASYNANNANDTLDVFNVADLTSLDIFPQNEAGITAPGSVSDQQFHEAGYIPLEFTKHSMVFQILGETEDNRAIREAVTVKHKPRCVSCGTINRHNAKFCSECGTSLQVV